MGTLLGYALLFGIFAALLGASLLAAPDTGSESSPGNSALTPPERYLWVLLLEITPPGEEFPTLLTKRSGAYVSPDRRQESVGGTAGDGMASDRFVTIIGEQAWERSGGRVPGWTPVDDARPALDHAGDPPYWDLFTVSEAALADAEPQEAPEESSGTPASLYELPLTDLPGLHDYLVASLKDALPELALEALNPVPVRYWLQASDGRPVRLQIFPPEEVVPGVQLSFNISLMQLDDPLVSIDDPAVGAP